MRRETGDGRGGRPSATHPKKVRGETGDGRGGPPIHYPKIETQIRSLLSERVQVGERNVILERS